MRWLLRLVIFWAICLPLFYVFGLPRLLNKLSEKARADSYAACFVELKKQNIIDTSAAVIRHSDAENYCHCVTDGLILTRDDLPELAQHHTSSRLNAEMKPVVDACNRELQQTINHIVDDAPEPRTHREKDGSETIHF